MEFHPVYDVLSREGLTTLPDLQKVEDWPEAKLRSLQENVYAALSPLKLPKEERRQGVLDPFKFVASASMRGDAGCTEAFCRHRKLDALARYAALYATSVVVPIGMPNPEHWYELSYIKPRIEQALLTVLSSRLLVNSGRFILTNMKTAHHCIHEIEHIEMSQRMIGEFMELATENFARDFTVRYQRPDKSPSGLPSIYIDGPEDFLEHGSLVYRELDGKEPKLSTRRKFDSEGMTTIRGKQKLPFLWPVFEQIGQNSSFYLAFRMHHDVRLLTDMSGEALFLNEITDDESLAADTSGLQKLAHALPLLNEMPVETLLRIRDQERESFEAYRVSISEMAKHTLAQGMSEREASEYFSGQLAPKLSKIRKEIALERKRQTRRIATGVASLAAGIAIGALAGLPTLASVPIMALGTGLGGNLLRKAVESKCEHGADLRQENDLYFLMSVIEEQ